MWVFPDVNHAQLLLILLLFNASSLFNLLIYILYNFTHLGVAWEHFTPWLVTLTSHHRCVCSAFWSKWVVCSVRNHPFLLQSWYERFLKLQCVCSHLSHPREPRRHELLSGHQLPLGPVRIGLFQAAGRTLLLLHQTGHFQVVYDTGTMCWRWREGL